MPSMLEKFKLICLSIILFGISNVYAASNLLPGLKKIIDRGEIVISFTPNNTALFTIVDDNGNITGIDMDIAKIVASDLGVKLKVITSAKDWNSVIEEVTTHQADLGISYLSITAPRAKKVLYSEPYVNVAQTLLFNNLSKSLQQQKGHAAIKDMFLPDDGMTLATFVGSSYEEYARDLFPGVKLKTYETTLELIHAVLIREVDALLIDELEASSVFSKNPGYRLKLTEVKIKDRPDYIAIAVDPDNRDLLEFVNNVMRAKQISFTIDSASKYIPHQPN